MLFDLRSRGRRRTVQFIYFGLALVMVGGLLLVGVGTGSSGGLLNAFTNSGSSSGQNQAISQAMKTAEKAVKEQPNSAAAWAQLLQAQYTAAGEGSNYDSTTNTYTASGKQELRDVTNSWVRYSSLSGSPNADIAIFAARAYAQLSDYAGEADAWEMYTLAQPKQPKGFECLAASAYAAKQTRKASLAAAKAVSLTSKLEQLTVKQLLQDAKTSPVVAQEC
ncbi:MAG: hypothetical protein ACLP0J_02410 [Solirubrobacteraceae bacterium]